MEKDENLPQNKNISDGNSDHQYLTTNRGLN